MRRIGLVAVMFGLLAGCASGVKLDDIPVEDKAGMSVGAVGGVGARPADSAGSSKTGVTAVDLGKPRPDLAGPVGASVVYFDYDSSAVKAEFQPVVEVHARHLRADGKRKAVLEGHTDERGGREYNLALGQKRAESVARALVLLGVTSTQMEAVSFGKEKPAAAGQSEDAMAKNRRVEVKYQ